MSLTSIRVALVLAFLAALGIGTHLLLASERRQGALQCEANVARAVAAAASTAAAESARRVAAQTEIANETQRIAARDRARRDAESARVVAVAGRLRDDAAAVLRAATSDTAPAGQCAATAAAFSELFGACRERYADLGRQADADLADARSRSGECAARYDALTPAP